MAELEVPKSMAQNEDGEGLEGEEGMSRVNGWGANCTAPADFRWVTPLPT